MVLDIRDLDQSAPTEVCLPDPQTIAPTEAPIEDSLEIWLERAVCSSSPRAQARAIEQLRQLVPSATGFDRLWAIVVGGDDPRRLLAAQLLGYHRQWLSSRSRLRQWVNLVRQERDPAISCALVWCLRQRNEIGEFLVHRHPEAAREAALGLPLNRQTLPRFLEMLLVGAGPRSEGGRILLEKLRGIHPSSVRELVDFLLQKGWSLRPHRLTTLFAYLPQLPLFEILLEERQLPTWRPDDDSLATCARIWPRLVGSARQCLEGAPSFELVRYLCTRSSEDEIFARRHARLLRAVVEHSAAEVGEELIAHLEHLTFRASEQKIARLAQLVVELSEQLEGNAGAQATSLLDNWKNRSADLCLKIYHLQHNLT